MSAIELYARDTPGHAERVQHTLTLLQEAARNHAGRIVQATSLGAEDMVITDLIARHQLAIPVATLLTGKLHPSTVALLPRIRERYAIDVRGFEPSPQSVIHFVQEHGERAMFSSIDLRKQCCAIRKLAPLATMLEGQSAWITGLRREQSDSRAAVAESEADATDRQGQRVKLNPLANWSWADVWHYIQTHGVPYNPLHDAFMPSIGCEPCTRAIAVGEPFRAGRWWWEDEAAKECGLHVKENMA